MKHIGTKFSIVVGIFALTFSGIVLYRAWSLAQRHTERLTNAEAELALAFDLAIRKYARETIRPEMEKRVGPGEFVVETMSTSFIARRIIEDVRKQFPDYIVKFPAENPRNPLNKAGPEEQAILQYFRENPHERRWEGRLMINGKEYMAHLGVMRVEAECLHCHGLPQDAPKSLLARYGSSGGFHHKVGDIAGMDMIAIPMDKVNASLASEALNSLLTMGAGLVLLFAAIFVAHWLIVDRRLAAITEHFRAASRQESSVVSSVPVSGKDEISSLASSFNVLASRLQTLHESLEHKVRERTEELSIANDRLRGEIQRRSEVEQSLRHEQHSLKQLLRTHDHERQVISYEIHDGLAQQLTGAIMAFSNLERICEANPAAVRTQCNNISKLMGDCLAEARRLINGVRPPLLDEQGVVVAVQDLIHQIAIGSDVAVEFYRSPDFGRLEPVLENAAFRIVQEALNNAMRHSKSQKMSVSLIREDQHVRVEVQDWGIGFDAEQTSGEGVGLKGIRERTRLLGGQVTVESKPGSGTKIVADLPLEPPEDDGD
jgi:signal transduction histidine kinase